jgi:hypothetical protein
MSFALKCCFQSCWRFATVAFPRTARAATTSPQCPSATASQFLWAATIGRVRAIISAQMVPILAEVGMGTRSMSSILILLALSALSGFVLGKGFFSWPAILAAGAVLAPLSTVVLQNQDFDALSGISVIVTCLTLNQAAYVVGTNNGPKGESVEVLPQQRADDEPHNGGDDHIRGEHKRQQNTQFKLTQLAKRQANLTP